MDGASEQKYVYEEKQSTIIKITSRSERFSRSERIIEKACDEIVSAAKERGLEIMGPFDHSPQVLKLKARLAPRDGVEIMRPYELHLLTKLIKIYSNPEVAKQIASATTANVEIQYLARAMR